MHRDLRQFEPVPQVLDGGWATQLQRNGMPAGSCPELWMQRHPEAVRTVAEQFLDAGSDIILTNSFQANALALRDRGAGQQAAGLAEQAAEISVRAARGRARVFGSIGPSGYVVMSGQISSDRIFEAFAEQAEALQWGGVDGLVLETFQELDEMRLAVRACRHATDLPVVGCMSFQAIHGRYYTQLGVKPEALGSAAGRIGLDAVGLNCGTGLDDAVAVACLLLDSTDLPVWVKSNAGLPSTGPDGRLQYPCGYRQFADYAGQLAEMGVACIGGCCGADPACIEAIRASVDGYLAEAGSKN